MKKMFFGLLATVLVSAYSYGQSFEESVALMQEADITNAKGEFAQAVTLKSFSTYKLLPRYVFNSVDFTDDGKNNDVKAGDGIYTAIAAATKAGPQPPKNAAVGEKFKYRDQLASWLEANRMGWGISINCKFRWVYTGTSVGGNPCNNWGCLEIYDCSIGIGFGRDKK